MFFYSLILKAPSAQYLSALANENGGYWKHSDLGYIRLSVIGLARSHSLSKSFDHRPRITVLNQVKLSYPFVNTVHGGSFTIVDIFNIV